MKKIIFVTSTIVFAIFLLNSCIKSSEVKTIKIPKDEELIFSKEDEWRVKNIIVIENNETITIDNINFIQKICYFKQAYPEKDITIRYHKNKKGEISWLAVDK